MVTVAMSLATSDKEPALLLDGELFGWLGENEAYPDRHFPELEILIDGVKLAPAERFEAFVGKNEISNPIRAAGMDPWAIAHTPPITPANGNVRIVRILERMGAVQRSADDYWAKWKARRLLRIALKPSLHQHLELRYLARPALAQVQVNQLLTGERQPVYCLSADALNKRLPRSRPAPVHVAEYSIATGIDAHTAETVLLTNSAAEGSLARHVLTFACGPHRQPVAVAGNFSRQAVQPDQEGLVRVLEVTL